MFGIEHFQDLRRAVSVKLKVFQEKSLHWLLSDCHVRSLSVSLPPRETQSKHRGEIKGERKSEEWDKQPSA
jgi:hypothetical protein